jgi:DNA-binding beta-propeller fold protein YncE
MLKTIAYGVAASCLLAGPALGQIAVSSNDHKVKQENGVTSNAANPTPDSITILDLSAQPVKVLATINNVPGSVVGPPLSVAITPDESIALVASSSKIDPADKTKLVPDDRVSVVDLKERKVIETINTDAGAAGISITKDGKRAYVSNRMAGTVSILAIDGKKVSLVKTIEVVPAAALLSHVAVSPDGTTAVATRNGDAKVVVAKLGPDSVTTKATLDVTPRPYAVSITPDGKYAVVGSLGDPKGNGVFTVIDISGDAPKIVATMDIGYESLEGGMMSNDGKWVAGVAHGGSTRPKDAPQFKPNGMVVLYQLDGGKLTKVGEAPIGAWSQGASFSKDGKILAVQNMIQKNIQIFRNDNGKLTDTGQKIDVGGGAAAIRSSTDR